MIRQATKDEIEFYEKALYPLQDEIFELIKSDKFYLSGGTCLSRFYYDHRFSDDLDFFFDGYRFQKNHFEPDFNEITQRIEKHYPLKVVMNEEYFKRLFVYKENISLKIEFIFENFKTLGQRQKINTIKIDTKENITANKLTAIQGRRTYKDFIDLYYLLKDIKFEDAVKWAEYKMVPLDYEGLLINFADEKLEGQVLMKQEISKESFNNFIKELIKRLLDNARST